MNKVEHFRVATSPFKTRYDNFIGGKFVAPNAGRYFENTSPVTGQTSAPPGPIVLCGPIASAL